MDIIEQSRDLFSEVTIFRQISVFLWKPIWHKRTQKWWNVFVHIIFETRVIHEMCTIHLTRYFRRSKALISHHRFQVWWTIRYIFMTGVVQSILSKTLVLRVQKLKQPIFWYVNSVLNQNMSKRNLASCATCKTRSWTLSLRISEHSYWIGLCYVQSTDICDQNYCVKYYFKRLKTNELY